MQETLISRGCPGGCSLWQNKENPFIKLFVRTSQWFFVYCDSELPVYHLKHIAPEPQESGTAEEEEAPTQIDIRQHGILYQNACEWQWTCVYHLENSPSETDANSP